MIGSSPRPTNSGCWTALPPTVRTVAMGRHERDQPCCRGSCCVPGAGDE
ncbi:MAG: hypothetical protein MZV64_71585 [Ignavibacteriales bacterium]|nr:hypothetical protein [Ignavibacteriales bacterium]